MKNNLKKLGGRKSLGLGLVSTALLAVPAMAQGSGNAGADAIITEVGGLAAVAVAVVAAAVLVVVVPWGAKMAVRAFKSIGGA